MSSTVLSRTSRGDSATFANVMLYALPAILAAYVAVYVYKLVAPFPVEVDVSSAAAMDAIARKMLVARLVGLGAAVATIGAIVLFRQWRWRVATARFDALPPIELPAQAQPETLNRFLTADDFARDERTGSTG